MFSIPTSLCRCFEDVFHLFMSVELHHIVALTEKTLRLIIISKEFKHDLGGLKSPYKMILILLGML